MRNIVAFFAAITTCAAALNRGSLLEGDGAISGTKSLGEGSSDFNLTWSIDTVNNFVQFTLSWNSSNGMLDWAAFGLHQSPGSGMPNAEIFMCSPYTCQVRNSLAGYTMPSLDDFQYIKLIKNTTTDSSISKATFSRDLNAIKASPLSYNITNRTMGIIYARGKWDSGSDNPKIHDSSNVGRDQINFFMPGPGPAPHPSPGPSPVPQKKPGVWPSKFDSNMTIAAGQLPVHGQLGVGIYARLRYDFAARSQLWEYFKLDPSIGNGDSLLLPLGGELWVNQTLYSFSAGAKECQASDLGFSILRPDWLQSTSYATTNYLLRQPTDASGHMWSNYTLCDLYKVPNTIAMTNSWLIANSSIGEPVRLEGPNDFNHPKFRSILEFIDFKPINSFPSDLFEVPSSCRNGTKMKFEHIRKSRALSLFVNIAEAMAS